MLGQRSGRKQGKMQVKTMRLKRLTLNPKWFTWFDGFQVSAIMKVRSSVENLGQKIAVPGKNWRKKGQSEEQQQQLMLDEMLDLCKLHCSQQWTSKEARLGSKGRLGKLLAATVEHQQPL